MAVYIVMDSDRGKAFGRERKKEEAGRLGSEEVGKIKTEKIQGSKLKDEGRGRMDEKKISTLGAIERSQNLS